MAVDDRLLYDRIVAERVVAVDHQVGVLADFDGADIEDTDFDGADLSGAKNLRKAKNIQDADFKDTECPDGVNSDTTTSDSCWPDNVDPPS